MHSFKKDSDPGWNDPPKFSYCESKEFTNSPKRNFLNKRVAFPMHQAPSIVGSAISVDPTVAPVFNNNLPPPPLCSVPSTCEKISISSTKEDSETCISDPAVDTSAPSSIAPQTETSALSPDLNCILQRLEVVVDEKSEALNQYNKLELIKRKLQIMKESWTANKLPDDVKRRLNELSNALLNKDRILADQIQVSLMVDYPKQCSEFIPALRQLINAE